MWHRWDDRSYLIDVPNHLRGQRFIAPTWFLNAQIDAQAKDGAGERAARRFVHAMQLGGCTDAEAYELMRDRFCAHEGTGHELWDVADIPTDRWFRDAWVRSHNGGPINVSLRKARSIQFRRITHATDQENARRRADIDLFDRPIVPDWSVLSDAIHRADDIGDLRRVWPEVLGDYPYWPVPL